MGRLVIVEPGQCLEDIALQEYGSQDGVTWLLLDNESVLVDGFCTAIEAGMELSIRDAVLDAPMLSAMRRIGVRPATNAQPESELPEGPDYNDDFNADHYIS